MPEGDLRNNGSGVFVVSESIMFTVMVVLFLCLLVYQPEKAMEGAKMGLLLWYQVVLPAQLPFVLGVKLLFKSCSFGKIPASLLCLLTGMISGYPVGALSTAQLYRQGHISKQNLTRLAAASNMAGPLFVIGTVGTGLLNNVRYGYYLLVVHWMSALSMAAFPAWRERRARRERRTAAAAFQSSTIVDRLGETVSESAELMLKVGIYIVLFSVIRQWVGGPMGALLEITGGIGWIAKKENIMLVLTGSSFLINYSGGCVLLQSLGAMGDAPVSPMGFLAYKAFQGFLGAGLMVVFCQFFLM